MDKLEKAYRFFLILKNRRTPISKNALAEELEVTPTTAKKYIDEFRDRYFAPLDYVPNKGYVLKPNEKFELPGLWLSADDVQSLQILLKILNTYSQGLAEQEVASFARLLDVYAEQNNLKKNELVERLRVIPLYHRNIHHKLLADAVKALQHRQQISIQYTSHQNNSSERMISPQRLVHYRDNWYLDAYCHKREELRTFMLSRIQKLEKTKLKAVDIPQDKLDRHVTAGYGIFAGEAKHQAKLRFLAEVAKDIAQQEWHPEQQGEWQDEEYVLTIPYSEDHELVMDILRYSPNVIVEQPQALKEKLITKLQQSLEQYKNDTV